MNLRDELDLLHVVVNELRKQVAELTAKVGDKPAKVMPNKVTKKAD